MIVNEEVEDWDAVAKGVDDVVFYHWGECCGFVIDGGFIIILVVFVVIFNAFRRVHCGGFAGVVIFLALRC